MPTQTELTPVQQRAVPEPDAGEFGAEEQALSGLRRRLTRHALWLSLITGGLAVVAALVDMRVTAGLIVPAVRDWIVWFLTGPEALSLWCLILAILAAFENRARLMSGFLATVLFSAALTHVLKWSVGRARPDQNFGAWKFQVFHGEFAGNFQSFPSGHSSAAVTVALLLGLYFPRARWVFYFYAAAVGLHRIIENRHFTSDVLAGWAVAALSVYVVGRLCGPGFFSLSRPRRELAAAD